MFNLNRKQMQTSEKSCLTFQFLNITEKRRRKGRRSDGGSRREEGEIRASVGTSMGSLLLIHFWLA